MQLTIDIPEQTLLHFGKQVVERELQAGLKRLRLREAFSRLSRELQEHYSEADYHKALEKIRADTWQEYKRDFSRFLVPTRRVGMQKLRAAERDRTRYGHRKFVAKTAPQRGATSFPRGAWEREKPDFTDTALVALAGKYDITQILTVDQRDFSVYRLPKGRQFERLWV